MKVWILTDEGRDGEINTTDAFSCCGVFSTKERALYCLRYITLGPELADSIEWEEHSPTYFEGVDRTGHYFQLYLTAVDGEVPQYPNAPTYPGVTLDAAVAAPVVRGTA